MMERLQIDRGPLVSHRQDRFELAGKIKLPIEPSVVERFLAQSIANQVDGLASGIVQTDGKHAFQLTYRVKPISMEQLQHDFCIRIGLEGIAIGLKVLAQRSVVVNFTVQDDSDSILGPHGLMSAGQIDDAESPHTEGYSSSLPCSLIVRPSVDHGLIHPMNEA
jgi:hypothetical protein